MQTLSNNTVFLPTHQHWFQYKGSMTGAIVSHFPSASFKLLEASVGPLISDEATCFKKKSLSFWTRHILFHDNNQPLLFARTVTPIQDNTPTEWVTTLGNTPLASRLFQQEGVTRNKITQIQLNQTHPYHSLTQHYLKQPQPDLTARRSLFQMNQHPLLITEIFLPHFLQEISAW